MILYFTGTGNDKFIADALCEKLDDEAISLNAIFKNNLATEFNSKKPYIVVAPIYAWRYPMIVEEFLQRAEFCGNKDIYCLATMGSETGKCDKYCQKIIESKGLTFKGFCGVVMPNNYIITDDIKLDTVDEILREALKKITLIVKKINNNEYIEKDDKTILAGIMSSMVNRAFNKYAVTDKAYTVSDSCVGCGKCVDVCPVNNIKLMDGKPIFNGKCLNCYSCLHRCPKRAINIGFKTKNKGRYVCPDYHSFSSLPK